MNNRNSKKGLEGHRPAFFLFGLILSMFAVLVTMQIRVGTEPINTSKVGDDDVLTFPDDLPPVTRILREQPKPRTPQSETQQQVLNPNLEKVKFVLNTDPDGLELQEIDEVDPIELFNAPDIVVPAMSLDRMPIFAGCETLADNKDREACFMQKLNEAVKSELKFNADDLRWSSGAMMSVEFVIDVDGKVKDVSVSRAPTANIEMQVERIISNLPEFIPGLAGGRNRAARMILPIRLRLN